MLKAEFHAFVTVVPKKGSRTLVTEIFTAILLHIQICQNSTNIDNFIEKTHPYTEAVFGWLQFIVATNQPFSCVANADYRKFSKYDSICKNTEIKYFNLTFQNVIESLANMIPNLFGIIFDGSLNILKYIFAYFIPIKFTRMDMLG